MSTTFQPPPTYADPVSVNQLTGKSSFNPIWLQWFLSVAQFISQSASGRLKTIFPITGSGTYAPSAGTNNVAIFAVGGGGGGGGAVATLAGQVSVGGGGGAGGMAYGLFTTGFSGAVITTGAAGAPGSSGGDSTFGSILTAHGGQAGASSAAGAFPLIAQGGLGGTSSGGAVSGTGDRGDPGLALSNTIVLGGKGAGAWFGGGGAGGLIATGGNATGFGAGGGGGAATVSSAAVAGGSGTQGFFIVMEYS